MNRRQLIKGIGAVICAGAVPAFVPRLVGGSGLFDNMLKKHYDPHLQHLLAHKRILISPAARIQLVQEMISAGLLNHIEAHSAIIGDPMCPDHDLYLLPALGG